MSARKTASSKPAPKSAPAPEYHIADDGNGIAQVMRQHDSAILARAVIKPDGKLGSVTFVGAALRMSRAELDQLRPIVYGLLERFTSRAKPVAEIAPTTATTATPATPATPTASAKPKPTEAEVVPPREEVVLPVELLRAALSMVPKKEVRQALCGVYLHAVADQIRIVASDGHRLLVASAKAPETKPAWTEEGVILSQELLAPSLALLDKIGSVTVLSYAKGERSCRLHDVGKRFTFSVPVIDAKFIDYSRIIANTSGALAGQPAPMESASLDPKYLKAVGALAAQLEAKSVTPFIGAAGEPVMFTFDTDWPVALYVMPVQTHGAPQVSAATLKMLAPGLKGTLAALKAHHTRLLQSLDETSDEKAADVIKVKLSENEKRTAVVMAGCGLALPKPKAEPKPAPTPKPKVAKVAAKPKKVNGAARPAA